MDIELPILYSTFYIRLKRMQWDGWSHFGVMYKSFSSNEVCPSKILDAMRSFLIRHAASLLLYNLVQLPDTICSFSLCIFLLVYLESMKS